MIKLQLFMKSKSKVISEVKSHLIFRLFLFLDKFLVFNNGITFHHFQMLMSYQRVPVIKLEKCLFLLFFLSQQTTYFGVLNKRTCALINFGKKSAVGTLFMPCVVCTY